MTGEEIMKLSCYMQACSLRRKRLEVFEGPCSMNAQHVDSTQTANVAVVKS